MIKTIITGARAPKLPISSAVKAGDYIFVSGHVGYQDYKTGEKIEGIKAQTRETLEAIKDLLEAAGSSLEKVVKVTVFLRNAADFAKMNDVYRTYFEKEPPARSTVVTDLVPATQPAPTEPLIEIECIAIA